MRVYTVTVKYSGQPERDAGDYDTREAAAAAAASLLVATAGPAEKHPVGVGIHESDRG